MGEWRHRIQAAQKGDVDAFCAIVREFQDMAVGYAFSILGSFQLAEDAAQEAFLQAYQDLYTLQEPQAFPAWLRRLVFKYCDRQTRRKRLKTVPLDTAFQAASKAPNPMQAAEKRELRQRVMDAIRSLPEHERSAVSLFYINGYSQAEVGEFLDVPAKTVKSRLYSARRKLRERMIDMVEDTLKKGAPDSSFAQRVQALVQENLTLPGTGGQSIVDAADVVERTLGFIHRFAPENITILTDLGQGTVQASPLEVHLILAPLCVNALQAMDGIGGELEVAVETVQPMLWGPEHPNIKEGKDFVCISVRDTGVGMHSLVMQRMFHPFYTTRQQGFGEGLPTALRLAKSLGGEIAFGIHPSNTTEKQAHVPNPKRGTTFEVYIPTSGVAPKNEEGMAALDACLRATGDILAAVASRYTGEEAINPMLLHAFLMRLFLNGLLSKGESEGELCIGLETMRAGAELDARVSAIEDGSEYLRLWVEDAGGDESYAPRLRQWVDENGLDSPLTWKGFDALLRSGGDHTRESEEEYFRLLGIVRIAATDMRGACDVAIRSDGGAIFSLYLPTV